MLFREGRRKKEGGRREEEGGRRKKAFSYLDNLWDGAGPSKFNVEQEI
ncbi:hypothetical protein [Okeania sp. KiyG1]|nr:hypothetical protein [Okeania sp. KiyG1]